MFCCWKWEEEKGKEKLREGEGGKSEMQSFVDKLSQQWLIKSALNAPNLSHSYWTKIARMKIDEVLNENKYR